MEIYKVGGCVRDKILGIESKDIDFTFVLKNKEFSIEAGFEIMTKWMIDEGFELFLSTPDCFTIRAKFPKNHQFAGMIADFVLARKEVGYIKNTRKPILELGTLKDDLIRRDFTVNALAEDIDGNLIDLFGGLEDIRNRILRTPLGARVTMMDDPLRVLRALRFSITKNFTISEDIWETFQNPLLLKKLESTVSRERIREELLKMFQFDTPRTFRLLMDVDTKIVGFLELIFKDGMWLQPTTKNKKFL